MKSAAFGLCLLLCACGQQLVDFADEDELDLGVGDLAGADLASADLAGADLTGQGGGDGGEDLSFPFDLSGDMVAPCRALQLDGVHAAATAAAQGFHNPLGAVTVEAWVYQTARTAESVVAGHWGDPGNFTASYLLTVDATGHLRFQLSPLGGAGSSVSTTALVPLNTWTHVAGVFTPGVGTASIAVFIDNASSVSTGIGIVLSPASVNGVPLHIGRFSTASPAELPFTGFMHDVRVSNAVKYPSATAPPVRLIPDAQTIALYHFDEASGSNAADASSHAVPAALLQNATFGVPPMCP